MFKQRVGEQLFKHAMLLLVFLGLDFEELTRRAAKMLTKSGNKSGH